MTKEIIIDGVDVAGCEYFKINRGFNCYKGYNCTDKECFNCYYKQLKSLEQEDIRLKEKIIELSEEKGHLVVENNILKEATHRLLELDKYRQKELENKAEATKSNIHNLALLSKANKALQEIKKIADARCGECKYGKGGITCKFGDCGEAKLYLITQLITKAEEK